MDRKSETQFNIYQKPNTSKTVSVFDLILAGDSYNFFAENIRGVELDLFPMIKNHIYKRGVEMARVFNAGNMFQLFRGWKNDCFDVYFHFDHPFSIEMKFFERNENIVAKEDKEKSKATTSTKQAATKTADFQKFFEKKAVDNFYAFATDNPIGKACIERMGNKYKEYLEVGTVSNPIFSFILCIHDLSTISVI